MLLTRVSVMVWLVIAGVKVTATGPPGHGSRFIENSAGEKIVKHIVSFIN